MERNVSADRELRLSEQQLGQLEQDLTEFEQQYDLSSEQFYGKFQAGEMGDAMDLVEWASLFQMAKRLRGRIDLLTMHPPDQET